VFAEAGHRTYLVARRVAAASARVVAVLAVAVGANGCIVEAADSAPPIVEPGRLTVQWTVRESIDPNLCVFGRAAAIDIAVYTIDEQSAGEYQAPCTTFVTSISALYPGTYYADALLIDSTGRARTTVVPIRPFTLYARTELVIDVDFPADSFLEGLQSNAVDNGPRNDAAPSRAETAPTEATRVAPAKAIQPISRFVRLEERR